MRHALPLLGLLLIGLMPVLASEQINVLEPKYKVSIVSDPAGTYFDWAQSVVFITTHAQAPTGVEGLLAEQQTRETALAAARQEMVGTLKAMLVTGYANVGDAINAGFITPEALRSVANAVIPVRERWDNAHEKLTLVSALPLAGAGSISELAAQMLATEQKSLVNGKPFMHDKADMVLFPRAKQPKQVAKGGYTGIIIDCSGMGYTPVLLPKLVAPDGSELWGTVGINAQQVKEKGLVSYVGKMKTALASSRAGAAPLIIRPLGFAGPLRGDLVLRADDVKKLQDAQGQKLLTTLSIVILID